MASDLKLKAENRSDSAALATAPEKTVRNTAKPLQVALIHRRNAQPDGELLGRLEQALASKGYCIFCDRIPAGGIEWANHLERSLCTADAVIAFLSPSSVENEMFAFEVEMAHEASQKQHQRPLLLPLRVNYDGPLPELLHGILEVLPQSLWRGPQDDERIFNSLFEQLHELETSAPIKPTVVRISPKNLIRSKPRVTWAEVIETKVEPVGGAVPLNSKYYVDRNVDTEFRTAIMRRDSIVLVKGARQMGKTSLLARGLQQARKQGARIVHIDLQKLNAPHFESAESLYLILAELIADELELNVKPRDGWDSRRGANVNFERFMRREVLEKLNAPLVWGLDEVDRLFHYPFGSEVFALFRSWHNERAIDPSGPWMGLILAIAYATEAHLFIRDLNQSPFNVGTRVALDDFTREQVTDLNARFDSPLRTAGEIARFHRTVGGQPYLVCRGLYEMSTHKMGINELEAQADLDEGLFGDHLRRLLVSLTKDPGLCEAMREVLAGHACPTDESFYRLRSAGVFSGTSQKDAHARCQIYATYLARHLM